MIAPALLHLTAILILFPAPRDPAPDDKGQGFFGVGLVDNTGVQISRIEPGSPADKAGIRINDTILAIDSQKVPSVNDAREIIVRLRPGVVSQVEVRRGEQSIILKVKVGARP